jgi:hypothetical protein
MKLSTKANDKEFLKTAFSVANPWVDERKNVLAGQS